MSDGLMPLVNELYALRNENEALRRQLAEQSVRIDEMLQANLPTVKDSLRYMTVAVEHFDIIAAREQLFDLLSKQLAHLLVREVPRIAQRVEAADSPSHASYYRFAFISLGGVK